jgi:hypothetical protein
MQCPLCSKHLILNSLEEHYRHEVCGNCNILYVYISKSLLIQSLTVFPKSEIHSEIKIISDNSESEYIEYFIYRDTNHAYSIKQMEKFCKLRVFW